MTDRQPDDDDWSVYLDRWGVPIPTDIAAVVGGYLGLALWFALLVGLIALVIKLVWWIWLVMPIP